MPPNRKSEKVEVLNTLLFQGKAETLKVIGKRSNGSFREWHKRVDFVKKDLVQVILPDESDWITELNIFDNKFITLTIPQGWSNLDLLAVGEEGEVKSLFMPKREIRTTMRIDGFDKQNVESYEPVKPPRSVSPPEKMEQT